MPCDGKQRHECSPASALKAPKNDRRPDWEDAVCAGSSTNLSLQLIIVNIPQKFEQPEYGKEIHGQATGIAVPHERAGAGIGLSEDPPPSATGETADFTRWQTLRIIYAVTAQHATCRRSRAVFLFRTGHLRPARAVFRRSQREPVAGSRWTAASTERGVFEAAMGAAVRRAHHCGGCQWQGLATRTAPLMPPSSRR